MSVVHEIAARVSRLDHESRPGASMARIVAFERDYSVRLPEDLRSFLELVDGSDEMDDKGFRLWPLAEIRPVEKELGAIHSIDSGIRAASSLPTT